MTHRILYIEDNLDNLVLVRRILKAAGFELLEATSARDGIDLAEQHLPELILMDINMPEMDGLAATRHLRKLVPLQNTPIIALTANLMPQVLDDMLAAGCDGYISKPVHVDTLPEQILGYLQNGRKRPVS
jgi:two-component system cell cycle response regulator DivK